MDHTPPPSYKDLQKKYAEPKNANEAHKNSLRWHEEFALWITHEVGTIGFFFLIAAWTIFWFLWNTKGPPDLRFDLFPGFVLWLFISNMIQLFLMPLIMVGQNLEARHSEARAEADYLVNTRSEKQIELILQHLEYQNNLIRELVEKNNRS